uniref:Uncharacterized protein n=1 Tax=Romanomermis culicivorax TaxID=13658 RepID=A0A915KZ42_ROMCU
MANYNFNSSKEDPIDKSIVDIESSSFSKKFGDEVFVELAKECDNLMSELVSSTPVHRVGDKRCRPAKRCVRFGSCGDETSISFQNKSKRESCYSTVSSPLGEEENFQLSIDCGDDFSNIVTDIDYQSVLSSTVHSGLVTHDIVKEYSSFRSPSRKLEQPGFRPSTLPIDRGTPTVNLPQSNVIHSNQQHLNSKSKTGCGDTSISPPLDLALQQVTKGGTVTGRASPLSGLGEILDWLRPRAFSDHIKNRRRSSGVDTAISSMSSSGGNGDVPSSYRQTHRLSLTYSRHKSSNGSNSRTTSSSIVRSPVHQLVVADFMIGLLAIPESISSSQIGSADFLEPPTAANVAAGPTNVASYPVSRVARH